MEKTKKEIKEIVLKHIRAGANYSQTKELIEKEGIKYDGLKNTFYVWSQQIHPTKQRDEALTLAGEKREKREKKHKKLPEWTSQKQKKADDSKLAELINRGLFSSIPCPQKGMKFEDVQKINVGGSLVATAQYYFPDFNLDHPLVVLSVRGIILFIKVKEMCYRVQQKIEEVKDTLSGIKPDWKK